MPDVALEEEAPALEVQRHGLVVLEARLRTPERGPRFDAAAFFWQASAAENDGCERVGELGACEISSCLPIAAAARPLPGFAWLSAGTVDISGTKLAFSFTEGSARGDYESSLPSREMSLWDGGEELRARVAGSHDFPALETSVTAPRPVTLTAPDPESDGVAPGAGLLFEWATPHVDTLYVEIRERSAAPYPKQREPLAVCSFPAERGRGFVPGGVFDSFSAPETLHGYRFRVITDSRTELEVDGAAFTFVALSESTELELPVASSSAPSAYQRLPDTPTKAPFGSKPTAGASFGPELER